MNWWPPLVWLKEVCLEIGKWLTVWFEEYRFVRRSVVFTVLILLVWIAHATIITNIEKVTEPSAKVIIAYIGLLSIVLAFYQWSRDKDDKR